MVESSGDSGEGINEGAIKIKNESANHGNAIIAVNGFFERCFDRRGKFWE